MSDMSRPSTPRENVVQTGIEARTARFPGQRIPSWNNSYRARCMHFLATTSFLRNIKGHLPRAVPAMGMRILRGAHPRLARMTIDSNCKPFSVTRPIASRRRLVTLVRATCLLRKGPSNKQA